MEIQKRKISRKKIIIATLVIFLIAGGIGGYFAYNYFNSPNTTTNNVSTVNYDQATNDQKNAGNKIKDNSVNTEGSKTNSGSDQAESPVPQTNGKGKVSAIMTAANQNSTTMQLRFDIGGVTSTGTCTLTLKKGSSTVTKTASVQALAGATTCKGFDIPTSELSVGTWQVTLHFENDDLVADTSGTVEVKQTNE